VTPVNVGTDAVGLIAPTVRWLSVFAARSGYAERSGGLPPIIERMPCPAAATADPSMPAADRGSARFPRNERRLSTKWRAWSPMSGSDQETLIVL